MPILTILAGPNGAGKTRYSKFLLEKGLLPIYPLNLDLLRDEAIEELQYDLAIDTKLPKKVDTLFYKYCQDAIQNNLDFCYECNFRKSQVKNVELFEKAGYKLHLIYFILNDIEKSKERVAYRVKYQEGNNVDINSISINFNEGLQNLDNHFQDFDKVIIIDNSIDNGNPAIQLDISNQMTTLYNKDFPSEQLKPYFPRINSKIQSLK